MARTDPRRGRPKRRYKIRGPETWALIRESYLAGASARELARRYDVTEWAIWRRAWREEWTKRHRAEAPAPEAISPFALTGADVGGDPGALKRRALAGVERAMAAGRLDEAAELARLAASLGRIEAATPGGADGGAPEQEPEPQAATYGLAEVARALLDEDYAAGLMAIDPDDPVKDPVKAAFWKERREQMERLRGVNVAFRLFVEATGGKGVEYHRDGIAAAYDEVARYRRWRETIDAGPAVPPGAGTG